MTRIRAPSDPEEEEAAPPASTAKGKGKEHEIQQRKKKKGVLKKRMGVSGPGISIPGNEEGNSAARQTSGSEDESGKGKKRAPKKQKPALNVVHDKLFRMTHEPTKFPEPEILKKLGIYDDVMMILEGMGLSSLMGMRYSSHKDEICEFLATLKAEFFSWEPEEDWGSGYITFTVKRKRFQVGFTDLSKATGIPEVIPGDHRLAPCKKEGEDMWRTIGSTPYAPSRIKNTEIKHPAVRYVHKILTETYYGKKESGGVKEYELAHLSLGLRSLLDGSYKYGPSMPDRTMNPIGMFVQNLLEQQEYAWNHSDKKPVLKIGGLIHPILVSVGIKLRPYGNIKHATFIDEAQLAKWRYLGGKAGSQYAYKYNIAKGQSVKVLLPNTAITSVATRENIYFQIDRALYYSSRAHGVLSHISVARREVDSDDETATQTEPEAEAAAEETEETERVYGSARYHFDPIDQPLPPGPLQLAHQQIRDLQRWNKWQDRGMRKMAAGFEKMKKQLDYFKKLLGRKSKSKKRTEASAEEEPVVHEDEAGPSEPPQHRRSVSADFTTTEEPAQFQRSATTGRRQRRRMKTPSPPISDNESMDFDFEFSPEPSCSPPHYDS